MKSFFSHFFKINTFLFILSSCFFLVACQGKRPTPVPRVVNHQTACSDKVVGGFPLYPTPQANDWFICHEGYALEYNSRSRTPVWVAEHLTADNLRTKNAVRQNDFRPDPTINLNQEATLQDFQHSGFDRGHMAPAEDFRGSIRKMSESFYLANMVPQDPDNNRGIWERLERNVRRWAMQRGQLYVFTGPIFFNGLPRGWIGSRLAPVAVPTHLYKIIFAPKTNEIICFIIPNTPQPLNALEKYGAHLGDIERLTGLNFFPAFSVTEQKELEQQSPSSNWVLR